MVVQVHMDLRCFCIFYFRFVEKIVLLHLFFPMKDDFYFMEARPRKFFFIFFSEAKCVLYDIRDFGTGLCGST